RIERLTVINEVHRVYPLRARPSITSEKGLLVLISATSRVRPPNDDHTLQLSEDVRQVEFDRALADLERLRDLPVAQSSLDQSHNRFLARRESLLPPLVWRVSRPKWARVIEELGEEFRCEPRISFRDCPKRHAEPILHRDVRDEALNSQERQSAQLLA